MFDNYHPWLQRMSIDNRTRSVFLIELYVLPLAVVACYCLFRVQTESADITRLRVRREGEPKTLEGGVHVNGHSIVDPLLCLCNYLRRRYWNYRRNVRNVEQE